MLPDNVLLEIFDSYRNNHDYYTQAYFIVWKWHLLAHVCRRWRHIIFESPRRLDLQILCVPGTPVRKHLGIWPDFPIALDYSNMASLNVSPDDEDNIIAALEHPSRVCHFLLSSTWWSEKIATAMQKPFPALRTLVIVSPRNFVPELSIPDGFLGGSAPFLQNITLGDISFPALPMFLSSASDLVHLRLNTYDIPLTRHISTKTMAACLVALPRLETFHFDSNRLFITDPMPPPPITRAILPALTAFNFKGSCEYLENLVARIDAPRLNQIKISYLERLNIQVVQLSEFFDRSVGSERSPFRQAIVRFSDLRCVNPLVNPTIGIVTFATYHPTNHPGSDWHPAEAFISYIVADWRFCPMSQVLRQFSPILSSIVLLRFATNFLGNRPLQRADDLEWVHLLHQFSMVKFLYLDEQFAWYLARALKSVTGEMVAKALSSLDLIYLKGPPTSSIQKFVDVRLLSDRPVTVVNTEAEFDERLKAYGGK